MLDGAQKLDAVALLLQGVIRGGRPLDRDDVGLELKGLLCLGGKNQRAVHDKGGADVLPGDLFVIIQGAETAICLPPFLYLLEVLYHSFTDFSSVISKKITALSKWKMR